MRLSRVVRTSEAPANLVREGALPSTSAAIARSAAHDVSAPAIAADAGARAIPGLAKRAGACVLAGALTLGFGLRAHAGQLASETGAQAGRAHVKGTSLDVGPEVISAAVDHTLRAQARTEALFTLPKPDERLTSPPDHPQRTSKLADVTMARIFEIVNEEPRTRQRLMETGGVIGFDELTIGQQNRITDALLAAGGIYGLFDAGTDEARTRKKLEDVLAAGLSIVLDPVALGVGLGYSAGHSETGRYSMSITYDRARSGPSAPVNGLELMIDYQLAF